MDCSSVVSPQANRQIEFCSNYITSSDTNTPKKKHDARRGLEDTRQNSTFPLSKRRENCTWWNWHASSKLKILVGRKKFFFSSPHWVWRSLTPTLYSESQNLAWAVLRIWKLPINPHQPQMKTWISSHPARTGKLRREVCIHAWVPAPTPTRKNPWITRLGWRKKFSTSLLLASGRKNWHTETESQQSS